MPFPKSDTVSEIIRNAAREIIMPRFQALHAHEIYEKRPGEVVTDIDIAAEQYLSERLIDLLPGSAVLGEESIEDNPALIDLVTDNGAVWIIDPIDGTRNFSNGKPCFAVMVALRNHTETIAGWIYDPTGDVMCEAEHGGGAWCAGERLNALGQGQDIETLRGSLGKRLSKRLDAQHEIGAPNIPHRIERYRCCGREYMDLARGILQYLQYGMRLKPWDHAPGVLITSEAGCHAAFLEDAKAYDASLGMPEGHLMIAPDEAAWHALHDLLWA